MKEKKLIASVILGVALVSLITALVAAFAEVLTFFIDWENVQGLYTHDDYNYIAGGLAVGGVFLGVAFVAVFFANKKNRFKTNLGLAVALISYCVVSLIVLRILIPSGDGYFESAALFANDYALFTSYMTTAITLMVSCALTIAAWLYLTLIKKKETPAKQELETEEKQEKQEKQEQN